MNIDIPDRTARAIALAYLHSVGSRSIDPLFAEVLQEFGALNKFPKIEAELKRIREEDVS